MSHKYFAYRKLGNKYMNSQKLLGYGQIANCVNALMKTGVELFSSIQDYDQYGRCLGSPIYADLDGPTALQDTRQLVSAIQEEYMSNPQVFFSGNKGFHVILDYYIAGPDCHLIVKEMMDGLGSWKSLDYAVYTQRRQFRLEGAKHHKTGLFKTRISTDELFMLELEAIKGIATKSIVDTNKQQHIDKDTIEDFDAEARVKVTAYQEEYAKAIQSKGHVLHTQLSPCIEKCLASKPFDGEWNIVITSIARFFNSRNLSYDQAMDMFMQYEHWQDDYKHVEKVMKTIYQRPSLFGCKGAEHLERFCDVLCEFNNKEELDFKLVR
ncbi:hypothetical protein [Flavobacterium alkalisoli]|uniref:hypothetical protein n=1 Tax=Flavobacterium alkalisoli TaxID=2602769 RepID=UPI003A8D43F5